MYPLYEIERGKQRGTVKQFIFVPESEYNALIAELGPKDGLRKAKRLEYDRIRSRRISTNPEERAHWSARRLGERTDVPQMPVSANVSDDWTASQLRSATCSGKSRARPTRSPDTRDAASVDSPAYGIGVIVRRLSRLYPSMVCHDSIGGFLREPLAIFDSGKSSIRPHDEFITLSG
jgi:hypothetical protein